MSQIFLTAEKNGLEEDGGGEEEGGVLNSFHTVEIWPQK